MKIKKNKQEKKARKYILRLFAILLTIAIKKKWGLKNVSPYHSYNEVKKA
jgi:hypothetical protein